MLNQSKKYLSKQLSEQQKVERDSLFATCTLVDGQLYAFTSFKRLPVREDLITGETVILDNLIGYDPTFASDNILNVERSIFVLELNGNRLLKYDIKSGLCQYFSIGCHKKDYDNFAAFAQYGEYLYIITRYMEELIKIEIASGKVNRTGRLYSRFNLCLSDKGKESPWYGFQDRNKIWFLQKRSNLLIAYDMKRDAWKKYELSIEINDCVHIVQYGGKLYILSSEGKVYCWNIEGCLDTIVGGNDLSTEDNKFIRIAVTDKKLFLLPALGEDILWVDLNTKEMEKCNSYPNDFRYCGPEGWSKYYGYCEDNDYYYFALRAMNYSLLINKKDGEERWLKPKVLPYEKYQSMYVKYNRKVLDETECGLDIMVSDPKKELGEEYKECISIGKKIWAVLKT